MIKIAKKLRIVDLLKGFSFIASAQTGGGKTTFINTFMFQDFLDKWGRTVFRCHIFPDPKSVTIYRELGIPIYETFEEVYDAYVNMKVSHCGFLPEPELQTGVPPKEEVLFLLTAIFNIKYSLMKDGKYDTNHAYFMIDEFQKVTSAYSIDPRLQEVVSEGRKYGMFIFGFSQSLKLVNNFVISQANMGIGYIRHEDRYLASYGLEPLRETYAIKFTVKQNDGSFKTYISRSRKSSLKEIKKIFKMRKTRPKEKTLVDELKGYFS